MEWEPTVRFASLKLAAPVALSVATPIETPSTLKVTVPVGMPPLPLTWTEKVTGDRTTEGFRLEATVLVVVAICTVSKSGAEALAISFVSPG